MQEGDTDPAVLHLAADPAVADAVAARLPAPVESVDGLAAALAVCEGGDGSEPACVVCGHPVDGRGAAGLVDVLVDHADAPVVVFTGAGSETLAGRAVACGAAGYVPFTQPDGEVAEGALDQLAERVRDLTRGAGDAGSSAYGPATDLARLVDRLPGMAYRCANEPGWPMTFVSRGARDLVGYDPADLVTDRVSWGEDVIAEPADRREEIWEAVQAAGESGEPFELTYRVRSADGDRRWVWERGYPVERGGSVVRVEGFLADVTEQRARERRLAALHDATRELLDAATPAAVFERAVAAARETLGVQAATAFRHDPARDVLEPVAGGADPEALASPPTFAVGEALTGRVFGEQSTRVCDDVPGVDLPDNPDTGIGSYVGVPLGDHGVLAVAAEDRGAFDDVDVDLVRVLGANAEAALDRVASEQAVRDQRDKAAALNAVATDLAACETETAVCETAAEAASGVLEFALCTVSVERDGVLEPLGSAVADPDRAPLARPLPAVPVDGESAVARAYRSGESSVDDARDVPAIRDVDRPLSVVSVPAGGVGAVQAVAGGTDAFDAADRQLADLLASHVAAALKRVRSQRDRRRERDRFAALFETIPDPVIFAEETGAGSTVRTVNSAFEDTFGVSAAAVRGGDVDEFVVPADREPVSTGALSEPGETLQAEVRRLAADGERDFLFRGSLVDTDPREEFGVYTDITEQRERERELQAANERLDEFASVLTHDLRTPLNVAMGRTDLARSTGDTSHLADVADALDRMDTLVSEVLALARGSETDTREQVAVGDAAERAWQTTATGDATLTVEAPPTVTADPDRLRTLFENLFRNSVEHGSADSGSGDRSGDGAGEPAASVAVRVGGLADGGGFFVADDGPGIPAEHREEVFEQGFSTASDGTGYGLSIVARVADTHGWTVDAGESERGGARFEVRTDAGGTEVAGADVGGTRT